MSKADTQAARGSVVEEEIHLTLMELCQACSASEEYVTAWVFEGVLEPIGAAPQEWRFSGQSLRRARLALWLTRDLGSIHPASPWHWICSMKSRPCRHACSGSAAVGRDDRAGIRIP